MPVTVDDLVSELEGTLGRRPVSVERRPHAYGSSYATEELDVWLDDSPSPLRLLLKDVSAGGLSDSARFVKPAFCQDPLREIETYAGPLAAETGPPRFYGSVVDPERGRYVLLIERIDGRELYQVGELAHWLAAARWLAGFHGRHPDPGLGRLIRHDDSYRRRWLARAEAFTGAPELAPIVSGYERVLERLRALPVGLVHGEFYASNVLIRIGGEHTVAPVDWEMAALAPGLVDLAALATGWSGGDRLAIVDAYRRALPPGLEEQLAAVGFDDALACCRLQLALQWLGWCDGWQPPADRAHDWLADAVEAWEEIR
jgi:hypothetical protein